MQQSYHNSKTAAVKLWETSGTTGSSFDTWWNHGDDDKTNNGKLAHAASQYMPLKNTDMCASVFSSGSLSMESGPLHTVDGRHPAHQLRLVAYPSIDRVLYIPGGAGFIPSTVCQNDNSGQKTQSTFLKPPDFLPKNRSLLLLQNLLPPLQPKKQAKKLESSRSEVLKSDRIHPD